MNIYRNQWSLQPIYTNPVLMWPHDIPYIPCLPWNQESFGRENQKTPLQRTNMRPRLVIRKEGKQQKTAKIVSATQIGHRSCSRIKHDAIESDGSTDEPMGKLFSSRPFAALDGIFSFIMLFATWHRSSEMKLPSVWHIVGTNILTT